MGVHHWKNVKILKLKLFLLLWLGGNISLHVRYSCLSIMSDDNTNISASLLMFYFHFLFFIFPSSAMIAFKVCVKIA